MNLVERPSITEFSHKNYITVHIPAGSYGLFRESARSMEKVVLGPADIIYSATPTSVNGTVRNCKRPDLFKGEIITQIEFKRRIQNAN